jgi:hypothetical protein
MYNGLGEAFAVAASGRELEFSDFNRDNSHQDAASLGQAAPFAAGCGVRLVAGWLAGCQELNRLAQVTVERCFRLIAPERSCGRPA